MTIDKQQTHRHDNSKVANPRKDISFKPSIKSDITIIIALIMQFYTYFIRKIPQFEITLKVLINFCEKKG